MSANTRAEKERELDRVMRNLSEAENELRPFIDKYIVWVTFAEQGWPSPPPLPTQEDLAKWKALDEKLSALKTRYFELIHELYVL